MPKNEILVYNYSKERLPLTKKEIVSLSQRILTLFGEREKVCLSLIFVSPSEIKKINHYWRKKNEPTTVLTFPYSADSLSKDHQEIKEKDLGDIFFCPVIIKKRAQESKISYKKNFVILLIHSLAHLYGYDHKNKRDSLIMEEVEKNILAKLNFK